MRIGMVTLAGSCVVLGIVPGLLVPTLAELGPQQAILNPGPGLEIPDTGSLPSPWIAVGLVAVVALLWRLRGKRRTAPTPAWACGQRIEPALSWSLGRFHQAATPRARGRPPATARSVHY